VPGFRQGMNISLHPVLEDSAIQTRHPQTKWTYNQGVIASGLGLLYAATGDRNYLTEAEKTLDAVVAKMTSGGILKEVCDDAVQSSCNEDQVGSAIITSDCTYLPDLRCLL